MSYDFGSVLYSVHSDRAVTYPAAPGCELRVEELRVGSQESSG